ncbi:hypothetical protein RHMOL_Rhmol09G0207600 [Rhododendron molle]|uniref:Uncharacterized protein n=1 Tax=Rhododendron molle TaxID=49168 RepID=A0ACC0MFJ8_RHOML|nr:hypothetical protein RHMOL_Rhmol09G0207600 [Rhododendron molle]
MNCYIAILLLLLLKFATSSNNIPDDFISNGYLKLDGRAELSSNGLLTLTDSSPLLIGHAFHNFPIQFKNSASASVISFSTTFIFAIVSENVKFSGHGIAFVMSPNKEIPDPLPMEYLGLFNTTNNGINSNHIVAVELDTVQDPEFDDINDNHVGVDINSLRSIKSAPAGYFADQNGSFRNLSLKSGDPMQVWVEYDGINRQLNVTMSPIHIPKPALPLLSLTKDLSPFLLDYMYVGFSSSTGKLQSDHYILGWSFKMNGQAQQIDTSRLPKLPQSRQVRGTLGYIAPELARDGKASTSTDLFAFGTFMLEVVCGRRPVDSRASPEEVILVDWVFECLERGNILEAIDRELVGTEYVVEEAELVLKLGLLCSHAIAAARPRMCTVVQYLEGRAQLPDNLGDIIKSHDFGEASNEQDVQLPISISSLTISEPFTSTGR